VVDQADPGYALEAPALDVDLLGAVAAELGRVLVLGDAGSPTPPGLQPHIKSEEVTTRSPRPTFERVIEISLRLTPP
jgi:hypothetical protein